MQANLSRADRHLFRCSKSSEKVAHVCDPLPRPPIIEFF